MSPNQITRLIFKTIYKYVDTDVIFPFHLERVHLVIMVYNLKCLFKIWKKE